MNEIHFDKYCLVKWSLLWQILFSWVEVHCDKYCLVVWSPVWQVLFSCVKSSLSTLTGVVPHVVSTWEELHHEHDNSHSHSIQSSWFSFVCVSVDTVLPPLKWIDFAAVWTSRGVQGISGTYLQNVDRERGRNLELELENFILPGLYFRFSQKPV